MNDMELTVLLLLPVIVHATVAYLAVVYVFKKKTNDLLTWMSGPKADEMWSKVGDKVIDRVIYFLEEDERSKHVLGALFALLKKELIQGFKEYIGGVESGTKNQIKAIAGQEMKSIGEAIKGFIFKKIGALVEEGIEGGK